VPLTGQEKFVVPAAGNVLHVVAADVEEHANSEGVVETHGKAVRITTVMLAESVPSEAVTFI
jgi:hypothetical protein